MQGADSGGRFAGWGPEGGGGWKRNLHHGVKTCWLEEGDGVFLLFGLRTRESLVAGWEGEESWIWSVIFADNSEKPGEVDFRGVCGRFIAEDADFDLFCTGR